MMGQTNKQAKILRNEPLLCQPYVKFGMKLILELEGKRI